MRIAVINGPNLNLLGTRRPDVYGTTTLEELDSLAVAWGTELDVAVATYQSNHEGDLIDRIHDARGVEDALVINPGAYTHTSYAIHDALEAVGLPTAEVHISNIKEREPWRRRSVVAPVCTTSIYGRGIEGYRWGLRHLVARAAWPVETIRYGDDDDQIGDLRLPDGAPDHPVAVIIHGGFWRDPWKRDVMDRSAVDLTDRGWATWNVEYRRVGAGGGWTATLDDVSSAIDALDDFGTGHGIDLDRVVTIGHSAGGQLALWAAGRAGLQPGDPGDSPRVAVAAAVALAGVSSLTRAHELDLGAGAVEAFMRRSPAAGDGRYRAADPAALLPIGVPTALVHGDADDAVPVDLSRRYVEAARDAGDQSELFEITGGDHMQLIDPASAAWEDVLRALDAVS